MTFEKISNEKYRLEDKDGFIDSTINSMVNNISNNIANKFNSAINEQLYTIILSRYISSSFIKKYQDIVDTNHHILVIVYINNKTYNVTLGGFDIDEQIGYLNGITKE